ncbi:MAG: GIY-YIG nuclease family protein [Patescibacteria group bacterium]
MFTVYILQSLKTGRYYIGHCKNLVARISEHNAGRVRSTKSGVPWKTTFSEQCQTRGEAQKSERKIKKYKGGVQFRALLNGTIRKR